jgi:hypothetical protein
MAVVAYEYIYNRKTGKTTYGESECSGTQFIGWVQYSI